MLRPVAKFVVILALTTTHNAGVQKSVFLCFKLDVYTCGNNIRLVLVLHVDQNNNSPQVRN